MDNMYPDAGKNAPEEVKKVINEFRELPDDQRDEVLLYHILGSGTPPYKMSKEDSQYVDDSGSDNTCGNCEFIYLKLANKKHICSQIRGRIQPSGWCKLYVPGKPE